MGAKTLTEVRLVVPGDPVPNARARRGKGGNWYTPRETAEFRERVQAAWMVEGRPDVGTGPLEVSMEFVFEMPPSYLKVDGSPRAGAPAYPPFDLDNFVKGPLDALNRLAYADDAQVVKLDASKRYAGPGEDAHTEIRLRCLS